MPSSDRRNDRDLDMFGRLFAAPLITRKGGNIFPLGSTVTANVTHFVSDVEVHMWVIPIPSFEGPASMKWNGMGSAC